MCVCVCVYLTFKDLLCLHSFYFLHNPPINQKVNDNLSQEQKLLVDQSNSEKGGRKYKCNIKVLENTLIDTVQILKCFDLFWKSKKQKFNI